MVSDTPEQWFSTLRDFFSRANKRWTIGFTGLTLELTPENSKDIADNILDALNALEHILAQKQQRAILFIDEFQEITKLETGQVIEGIIRHFAQEAKYLALIFSGSNRNILLDMFVGDRSRPLYNLCDRINLGRIDQSYYREYLNGIAQKTWHEPIKEAVFTTIMQLTECHPNYVYALCGHVWRLFPNNQPTPENVTACWDNYVGEQLKETRAMLSNLSGGQLKVLILIALKQHREFTGKEAQKKLDLTSGAIVYSLRALENMDYIEHYVEKTNANDNTPAIPATLRIINPVIRSTLEKFYGDDM